MKYKFLLDGEFGVIQDASDETILKTKQSATISVSPNKLIIINFGLHLFECMLGDIISIGGQVPSSIGDAIDKLSAVFPDAPTGSVGAANPSVTIGLTAKNGSADTYMRSDAAPAIDQSILPTWTGIHTFAANPLFKSALPSIGFSKTDNTQLGFINFGDGQANVPAFVATQVSNQLRIIVGNANEATFTFGNAGQFGIGNPVAFGTAGQALTSGGPTGPLTWSTLPVAANPTGSAGLTAVNGAATTFMRSDAAPAISQAITPVWTGAHTFTAAPTNLVPGLGVKAASPQFDMWNTSGAADTKRWNWVVGTSNIAFRSLNDDGTSPGSNAGTAFNIFRNGSSVQDVQIWAGGQQKIKATGTALTVASLNAPILNQPTSVALTAAQSGTIITNEGASTNIELTLPAATVGLMYEFVNMIGNASTGQITITPNGAETITPNSGVAGGSIKSINIMDSCKLVCHVAGEWIIMYDSSGDWTA